MNAETYHAALTIVRDGKVVPVANYQRRIAATRPEEPRYPDPDLVDLAKQPDVLARLHSMLSD